MSQVKKSDVQKHYIFEDVYTALCLLQLVTFCRGRGRGLKTFKETLRLQSYIAEEGSDGENDK